MKLNKALLNKVAKAQAAKSKMIADATASIEAKRKAEYAAKKAKTDLYEATLAKVREFEGAVLTLSRVYHERGGFNVGAFECEIEPTPIHYSWQFNRKGFYLFGTGDFTVAVDLEAGQYKVESRLHPRESLLRYEDIQHGWHWNGEPPKPLQFEFKDAAAFLVWFEAFVVANIDVAATEKAALKKAEDAAKQAAKATTETVKPDVELNVRRGLTVVVNRGGK